MNLNLETVIKRVRQLLASGGIVAGLANAGHFPAAIRAVVISVAGMVIAIDHFFSHVNMGGNAMSIVEDLRVELTKLITDGVKSIQDAVDAKLSAAPVVPETGQPAAGVDTPSETPKPSAADVIISDVLGALGMPVNPDTVQKVEGALTAHGLI